MQSESRTCLQCAQDFIIDADDFVFYEKMRVVAPTICPMCRLQRRLAWRNEINFYKRVCGLCKKQIISMYHESVPFPVYCSPCWWSDAWAAEDFGRDYDLSRDFFERLGDLQKIVPHEALQSKGSINSDYANYTMNSKNVYLSTVAAESEDCAYCRFVIKNTDCVDCEYTTSCQSSVGLSRGAYNTDCSYCFVSENCRDVHYSADCHNCESCFGCINLRHKKYHIFNTEYSKEEYEKKVKELRALPHAELLERVDEFMKTQPHRANVHFQCQNVTGDDIYFSVSCKQCFGANFVRNGAYLFDVSSLSRSNETVQDLYDCAIVADVQLGYEMIGGSKSYDCKFGIINDNCVGTTYSMFCYGCTEVLGCIGLRSKSYCILNKQYSKEEYALLKEQILSSQPGEFFPNTLCPFAYNESMAMEYFSLSEAEAKRLGYSWRPREKRNYTLDAETFGCAHNESCKHECTGAFRLIPLEKKLYERLNLPNPTLCPNCRRGERLDKRNPLKLWLRTCMNNPPAGGCAKAIEATYPPTDPTIIFCNDCHAKVLA